MIEIPHTLKEAILRGEAILFLGAGVNYSCQDRSNNKIPLGNELRDQLSANFLNGECKERSLEEVSSIVENEIGERRLSQYISNTFKDFLPNPGHELLPKFRWKAIFTLNYDTIIEKAYDADEHSLQQLFVFHRDQNSIERELASAANSLPIYKLHGCIKHLYQPDAPLILTTDSYVGFDKNRARLFRRLEDLANEFPIIFVGTRLGDPHIKSILSKVDEDSKGRPLFYYVSPDINQFEEALLSKKRMVPIKSTFEDFMMNLDTSTQSSSRELYGLLPTQEHSIQRHFRKNVSPSSSLTAFLTDNVDHVRVGIPSKPLDASFFFKGHSLSWTPIEQNFDIERDRYDSIMIKTLSFDHAETKLNIIILKGVSGAGKSVLSRRIAYDLAVKHNQLVLFSPPQANLRAEPLIELYDLTGKPIVLIVDQAADQIESLNSLISRLEALQIPINIILSDTQAAFGTSLEQLTHLIRFNFEIGELSEKEILLILSKLEAHKALGELEKLPFDERVASFRNLADRQLLVALYEATQGRPLEEILLEEYHRIIYTEAQELYLLVCTLNRFGVPIRAGLVNRVMGIKFNDFEKKFLAPLRGIVFTQMDGRANDYVYRTRHPQIADIVFRRILDSQSKQIEQYLLLINNMNTSYSSDNDAMHKMLSFRNLRELAPNLSERRRILKIAEQVTGGDTFVLQQQALIEMNDKKGNTTFARERLDAAQAKNPKDKALKHTRATLFARQAENENDELQKRTLRSEAHKILREIPNEEHDPFVCNLKASLAISELEEYLPKYSPEHDSDKENKILRLIEDAEKFISVGRSEAPDFEGLIKSEYRLRKIMQQRDKGINLLSSALQKSPHLEYVAVTYARAIEKTNLELALKTIKSCLHEKPGSKLLNQTLYELLLAQGDDFRDELEAPLRKSFSLEDGNILMHAHAIRFYFMRGERQKMDNIVQAAKLIRGAKTQKQIPRLQVKNKDRDDGLYIGKIIKLNGTFGFIEAPGLLDNIYFRPSDATTTDKWDTLNQNTKVTFEIKFTMLGPIAINLNVISDASSQAA